MQQTTAAGLRSAEGSARRFSIVPIYGANEAFAKGLIDMWARRTPAEALEVLRQPDVTVTNPSDKLEQLGKLQQLDERVQAQLVAS